MHAAAALAGADGLVLLGRGNDGVGLVGSAMLSAPATLRFYLVARESDPARLRAVAQDYPRVVLALLGPDAESRAAITRMTAAFADRPCWREAPGASNLRVLERACRE